MNPSPTRLPGTNASVTDTILDVERVTVFVPGCGECSRRLRIGPGSGVADAIELEGWPVSVIVRIC